MRDARYSSARNPLGEFRLFADEGSPEALRLWLITPVLMLSYSMVDSMPITPLKYVPG
jgi:hypothetical protein